MSKSLMSASFMWYKTFCFDVAFKREEIQKVCGAESHGALRSGHPQLQAQGLSSNAATFAQGSAATERTQDQTPLTFTSFSQTKPTLALPVENQALTALSLPTGAPDLTSKVKRTLPLPVPQIQAEPVSLLLETTSHSWEIPHLPGATGGVREPVSLPLQRCNPPA